MILKDIHPFKGQHCETTATGTLLDQSGIHLSEPMLFGLGEGLSYIFWNMKIMDYPFIGGRVKPGVLTQNIAANLNLELQVTETSSTRKAWALVKEMIDAGVVVGLKLDCFHLEYFSSPVHFAGHFVALYGYDDRDAYLVDTLQQGSLMKTSLKSLELARNEKGPMSSKNLFYTISKSIRKIDLNRSVLKAIRNNVREYLNPPMANLSYKGILKTSTEVRKWFANSRNVERDFCTTSMLMERGGTGGAIFRNVYRDFLLESYSLLKEQVLKSAAGEFSAIAEMWTSVASLLDQAGRTGQMKFIDRASDLLKTISEREKGTMLMLSNL